MHKYATHVRRIPHACEQEKQHADPLGALAPVIQQQLRDAGTEVEDGAEVAEDLAVQVEMEFFAAVAAAGCVLAVELVCEVDAFESLIVVEGWRMRRGAGRDIPAQRSGGADDYEGGGVKDGGFEGGVPGFGIVGGSGVGAVGFCHVWGGEGGGGG